MTIKNLVKSQAFGPHGILFTGVNPTREAGVTDSVISDCLFENIGVDSAWGAGIRLAWGSSRNQVLRNTIRDTGRGGVLADNGSLDLVIQHNRVSGSGGEGLGIEVWGGCDRAVIEDNRIDHWLSIGGSDFCAVRCNVISDKSGIFKFAGLEIIGSYCIVTDNLVDDGQHIGISVSGNVPKDYVFFARNTIRNCTQWGAQLQGEEAGIAYHYFYRCKFLSTSAGRGNPPWPGDEGHGFRINSNTRHLVLERCEFSDNARLGIQLLSGQADFLSFVRCLIRGNAGPAISDFRGYGALEWIDCVAEHNASDHLPPSKPLPHAPPTVSFEAPATARVGEPLRLQSDCRAAEGNIAMVLWDFGEGIPITEPNPTHAYSRPGLYRVTLIAWDVSGRAARAQRWVRVNTSE